MQQHNPKLETVNGHIGLGWVETDKRLWFSVDYLSTEFQRKLKSIRSSRDLLAKAIGIIPGKKMRIADLTMGLGYDAVQLASYGCFVFAWERNPMIYAIVVDARRRLLEANTGLWDEHFKVFHGDGAEVETLDFDAYYMDPMYPEVKRSMPRKELRALRLLAGDDKDAEESFLKIYSQIGKGQRIVVKRPDKSPSITDLIPTSCVFNGKAVRFDVYIKR